MNTERRKRFLEDGHMRSAAEYPVSERYCRSQVADLWTSGESFQLIGEPNETLNLCRLLFNVHTGGEILSALPSIPYENRVARALRTAIENYAAPTSNGHFFRFLTNFQVFKYYFNYY